MDRLADMQAVEPDDDGPRGGLAAAGPWLAVLALVLSAAAIAVVLTRGGGGGSAGDLTACRQSAWDAVVDPNDLPAGWGLQSTDLNANGVTVSIVGDSSDPSTNPPVVVASVTCYGDAAEAAIGAARSAAEAAGSTVDDRTDGGGAIDITTPDGSSTTTMFRFGPLVAQIADSGQATHAELDEIAVAVASAMGDKTAAGTGTGSDVGAGGSEEPVGSDDPGAEESVAPFAPELEAALPDAIADPTAGASPGATITLTKISASATDAFAQDQSPGTRALAARLRTLGKTFDDLQYAEAYDANGTVDAGIRGFRLPGLDGEKLRSAILETWLSSTSAGVKTETVTIAGKAITRVDYGDESGLAYVYRSGDIVIDVETSDPKVAEAAIAALK